MHIMERMKAYNRRQTLLPLAWQARSRERSLTFARAAQFAFPVGFALRQSFYLLARWNGGGIPRDVTD